MALFQVASTVLELGHVKIGVLQAFLVVERLLDIQELVCIRVQLISSNVVHSDGAVA